MLRFRQKKLAIVLVLAVLFSQTACPSFKSASDIEKVESKLDKATNGVNALAKTAKELYRQNVINLQERQLAGKIIEEANDGLEKVSDRVIQIDPNNPGSISTGKIDVEALLRKVIDKLNQFTIGNAEFKLAVQAVVLTINETIALVRLVKEVRK